MLNFIVVVWGSEFFLWAFTVFIQWSLLKVLSVTFKNRMGCKKWDAILRSTAHFEVPDVLVCFSSFSMFSWVL